MYSVKHLVHCVVFLGLILTIQYAITQSKPYTVKNADLNFDDINLIALVIFGVFNYLVVFMKFMIAGQMALGFFVYDCFKDDVKLTANLKKLPLISFRVVTRGDYPDVIMKILKINQDACKEVGLTNYIIEIVTEKALQLPKKDARVKQILVPKSYKTKNGTLFKGRNLQYCLENGVSCLKANDWIIHLDEDTMLTPSSVRGIANFIQDDRFQIGQGTITYDPFNNTSYLTKILTGHRLSMDYGMIRLTTKLSNKPKYGMKGSFVAVKNCVEKDVSFDGGLYASVVEFVYFSMKSCQLGYKVGWIDGVMREVGTLNVKEVMVQYRRGFYGMKILSNCKDIVGGKFILLLFLVSVIFGWFYVPLLFANLIYGVCPIYPGLIQHLFGIAVAIDIYCAVFQVCKLDYLKIWESVLLVFLGLVLGPIFFTLIFNICGLRAFLQKDIRFEVTKKEI